MVVGTAGGTTWVAGGSGGEGIAAIFRYQDATHWRAVAVYRAVGQPYGDFTVQLLNKNGAGPPSSVAFDTFTTATPENLVASVEFFDDGIVTARATYAEGTTTLTDSFTPNYLDDATRHGMASWNTLSARINDVGATPDL